MSDLDNITALRLQLLANGYQLTRNRDKRTFQKGWPTTIVDEAEVARWGRRFSRDTATGIRVEDSLAVIDFDINDKAMMARIVNAVLDAIPTLEDENVPLLVRFGSGAKEAWFVRTAEIFSRIHSRAWLAPGTSADDGAHRVEIFGGASPRQFGSFGPHTVADDGTVKTWYRWADASPATTSKSELPELTKAQFFLIADIVERELAAAGWSVVEKSTKGENDVSRVYDLTEEMFFDLDTGDRVSLQQLRELAQQHTDAQAGLRCSASWLEGPSAKRTDRCIVTSTASGGVAVWESSSSVTHCEVAERPDPERSVNELAAKMLERNLMPVAQRDDHLVIKAGDDGREVAGKLLQLYAFSPSVSQPVVPIHARAALPAMTLRAFKEAMTKHMFEVEAGDKTKKVNPVDWWLASNQLHTVAGVRMRPDRERPIYREGDAWFVNSYWPPEHAQGAGSAATGLAFMEQLAPDRVERAWMMQWLAYKFINPEVRGPALVMVAHERFGTGRGLFGQLIRRLFGARYVQEVPYSTVAGKTYQSQYTDWLSNNLIVIVSESSENEAGATSYQTKHNAYEHLKTLVDPGATEMTITRKREQSTRENVFASFVIATNHADALPIPAGDRRFAVITNGQQRETAFWDALTTWMADDANIAAFAEVLLAVDLTGYSPYDPPPLFAGKVAMVDMARSDLDRGLDYAVQAVETGVMTLDQVVTGMRRARDEYGLEYPERWEGLAKKLAAKRLYRVGVRDGANWHIKIGNVKLAVYAAKSSLSHYWCQRDRLREEVLKGDKTGPGSTVVALDRSLNKLNVPQAKASEGRSGDDPSD